VNHFSVSCSISYVMLFEFYHSSDEWIHYSRSARSVANSSEYINYPQSARSMGNSSVDGLKYILGDQSSVHQRSTQTCSSQAGGIQTLPSLPVVWRRLPWKFVVWEKLSAILGIKWRISKLEIFQRKNRTKAENHWLGIAWASGVLHSCNQSQRL